MWTNNYKNRWLQIVAILSVTLFFSFNAIAQMASEETKFVGNVFNGNTVPLNFDTYWNQITPENSGKWVSVESVRDSMNWTGLDVAYDHAQNSGYQFKQHTFVWGNQEPSWISLLSPAEQASEVEEWIQEYGSRYPDTDMIDVVNEPLHVIPSYSEAIGGSGSTGWDWVIWSFEKARQYNPNVKLLLNDYGILGNKKNTSDYLKIINLLNDRGLIDGIGVQAHGLEFAQDSKIQGSLDDLAATGLPIYISEMELDFADDQDQKNRYQTLWPLLYEHSGVEGVTLWGYLAGVIWKADAFLLGDINNLGGWTLSTSFADYHTTGSGDVQVHFTNDDEANENDAIIDYAILDGTIYQAEDMEVNTGVWQDGSCGSGGFSEEMHCNGYIQFPTAIQDIIVRARGVTGNETIEVNVVDPDVERPALQWLRYDYFGDDSGGGDDGGGSTNVLTEAEDGTLSGTTVSTSRSGYSGSGYVTGLDNQGDYIEATVDLASGGEYPLSIGYAADGDVKLSVSVNGSVERKNFTFASSATFTETGFNNTFTSGINTIRVFVDKGPSGGPADIDYFEVEGAESPAKIVAENESTDEIDTFALSNNYPNPFNPTTQITYQLPTSEFVSLEVFNMAGQKVATLVDQQQSKGSYQVQFDASALSSGIYIYSLRAGNFTQTNKMVLLK
ncbi:MAG: endo-1,4-beta-xylanase [Balneolaceae bacterium]